MLRRVSQLRRVVLINFRSIYTSIADVPADPKRNVPVSVVNKIGINLHQQSRHPLAILKTKVHAYFRDQFPVANLPGVTTNRTCPKFKLFDDLRPFVTTKANFDDLLVPQDHISRSPNDTYYLNATTILRCHTSAHQVELLRQGERAFLVAGDVYRRDEIDARHYPVFHQMEGVRVFDENASVTQAGEELRASLDGMVRHMFNDSSLQTRWVQAEFPFTNPSWEMEVFYNNHWLEVLGCGVVQPGVMRNANPALEKHAAWAFGIGLERVAMVLFDIPDIRLFWSSDPRFAAQFSEGQISKFQPFSPMPPCWKDISMWVGPNFTYNSFCEVVRNIAGDLVETVELKDEFMHPKTGKRSMMYRIMYRAADRSLTNAEVDTLQFKLRETVPKELDATLR